MEQQSTKWRATVTVDLPSAAADDAWSLLSVFGDLHRWVPSLGAGHIVSGVEGVPGCVRYCATPDEEPHWAKEELLAYDPAGRSYTYNITESNMGFGEYVATFAVVPAIGSDSSGSRIEWSYEADPVKGMTEDVFETFIRTAADGMAEKVEEALKAAVDGVAEKVEEALKAAADGADQ